jgi:hypothetical protein
MGVSMRVGNANVMLLVVMFLVGEERYVSCFLQFFGFGVLNGSRLWTSSCGEDQ